MVFKGLFSVIGLILFTAQVSYKFYYSASMPVYRASLERHAGSGAVTGTDAGTDTLSLDKRFDLKPSFGLLTPVFRFLHHNRCVCTILPVFIAPKPVDNKPVLTPLRGPPPFHIALS
ncbi:MAG TPA: hypothetical protein VGS79_05560 [Puia sp.]|nr:hypothetical protein [Puia sp.]